MFYRYEVRNNGSEDILYLYLDMAYEFSKELIQTASEQELSRRTENFINSNNIQFKGSKVYLIIDNIVVKTLNIKTNKNIKNVLNKNNYNNNDFLVTLKLEDNSMIEVTLKEYLGGSLGNFYTEEMQEETLKCLAILFRTYAYKMMEEKHYLKTNNEFQIYSPIYNFKAIWNKRYEEISQKLEKIINQTDNIFVTHNSKYILPFIHYCNTGFTVSNKNYPYLKEVKSLWDLTSKNYLNVMEYTYEEISKILDVDINNQINFEILEIENKRFIKKVKLNNKIFSGEELIKKLNLKSAEMVFIFNKKKVKIISKGWGHFLGLSLFGANELAKNNCTYQDILTYYFPTIKIMQYKKNF